MTRRVHIVVLAVTLLFANAWCVAQCNLSAPQVHHPPCHKHVKTACTSSVLVEAASITTQHAPAAIALLPHMDLLPPTRWCAAQPFAPDTSPPTPIISCPLRS